MQGDLLNQGLMLMGVGMGVVFVFLTTLVAATTLMSRLVMRLEPPPAISEVPADEIAAISAAIAAHRSKNKTGH